jgi:uncharacterized repeat protein (TIGR01451 family)
MRADRISPHLAIVLGCVTLIAGCDVLGASAALTVQQKDLDPSAAPGGFKTLQIIVNNTSSAVARGVAVRDTLPGGFSFVSTTAVTGDATRTKTLEPPHNSPSPQWGAWSVPAGTLAHPARLVLEFQVAVGRAPAKTPNFVEVTSDNTDSVAAEPAVLAAPPVAVVDMQVSARSPVAAGSETQYTIQLRNTGSSAARDVFISASLPPGFIYSNTTQLSGNALRQGNTDPIASSLLPSWGTWTIPPQQSDGSVGILRVTFTARVVGDEAAGSYPVSVTITFNPSPGLGLQAAVTQTVADQAPVVVFKPH